MLYNVDEVLGTCGKGALLVPPSMQYSAAGFHFTRVYRLLISSSHSRYSKKDDLTCSKEHKHILV